MTKKCHWIERSQGPELIEPGRLCWIDLHGTRGGRGGYGKRMFWSCYKIKTGRMTTGSYAFKSSADVTAAKEKICRRK